MKYLMKRDMKYSFIVMVLILFLGGCKTIQGGGWIGSASGEGKATFGVDLTFKEDKYFGEFTYHDRGVIMPVDGKWYKVVIHAWIEPGASLLPGSGVDDFNDKEQCITKDFKYRANKLKSSGWGDGTIVFCDADLTEDVSDEDYLSIELRTGPFGDNADGIGGYENDGELGGGNLTIYDE